MEYNEESELGRYVWNYFQQFCTELEANIDELFARQRKGPEAQQELYDRSGISADDPFVVAALRDGEDVFHKRVGQRILKEHSEEVFINRCPECFKIVKTPRAQRCF